MTSSDKVLQALLKNGGLMTRAQIKKEVGWSKKNESLDRKLSATLSYLLKFKYIRRSRNADGEWLYKAARVSVRLHEHIMKGIAKAKTSGKTLGVSEQ